MNDATKTGEKLEKPHAFFSEPREIVIDPALSKDQKIAALDHLEQDARQLLMASDEGMTGGEPNKQNGAASSPGPAQTFWAGLPGVCGARRPEVGTVVHLSANG